MFEGGERSYLKQRNTNVFVSSFKAPNEETTATNDAQGFSFTCKLKSFVAEANQCLCAGVAHGSVCSLIMSFISALFQF